MKNLREYITEAQQWIDSPAAGDDFAINIREECLLESHVVEVSEDAIVIEADDRMIEMLEQYGLLDEEPVDEEIRRYGAVGSSPGQGYTVAEGDIDPNRHPQTRDYGRGDDDEDEDKKTNPQPPMGDPWDYVQDSEQDFRRVMELAGVAETEANTTDPLADKAAALAPVGADGEQEPVATVDETQAPDQHLSRIRKLAGMAEGSSDQPGAPASVRLLSKDYDLDQQTWTFDVNGDEISFLTYGDYDDAGSRFNDPDMGEILGMVQRRTEPYEMITPDQQRVIANMIYRELKKGIQQLPPAMPPAQDMSEGVMSSIDMDLRHIAKTQRMDALVDAMRGEFGTQTQQYLHDMMDDIELALQQRGQGARENMEMKLRMLMDRIQKIYAGQDLDEAEYQGRKVELNKPTRGDVAKFKVYVKDPKTGNVKKVNFGDKTMRIKKSNPARRKSFRARHRCENPGPKTKARYWACRSW
jgi:hypothetical protein